MDIDHAGARYPVRRAESIRPRRAFPCLGNRGLSLFWRWSGELAEVRLDVGEAGEDLVDAGAEEARLDLVDALARPQRHHLLQHGRTLQVFELKLTELQRQVLALLGVPDNAF